MTTQYLFPVCIAAAAHGALLFGFSRPARIPTVIEKTFVTPICSFFVPPEEPPVIVEDARAARDATTPDVPQPPRGAEPPVAVVPDSRLTMDPPRISSLSPTDFDMKAVFDPGPVGKRGPGSVLGDVISKDLLDNTPRTRFQAAPIYPHDARRASLQGTVTVEFVVDEHGSVREPRVVSSTDRVFEEATLRAVAKWRFEPGRRAGQVVRFRMAAPVVFSLND